MTNKPPLFRVSTGRSSSIWLTFAAGLFALVGGISAMVGWLIGIPKLIDWEGNGINIKFNTALTLAVLGFGSIISCLFGTKSVGRQITLAAGAFAGIVGLLAFLQHIFSVNFGIDTLLFDEGAGQRAPVSPGRMGLPASASFILLGTALVGLTFSSSRRFVGMLGGAASAIALLSIVGYMYGAEPMYEVPRLTGVALQTALMIFALGVGMITAVPERNPMRLLTSDTSAGLLLRRLSPVIVIVPIGLGLVGILGQEAGLYDNAFGTAALVLLLIAMLLGVLVHAAYSVRDNEHEVLESREKLKITLSSIGDGVITTSGAGIVTHLNPVAEELTGWPCDEAKGRPLHEIFRIVNETTRESVQNPAIKAIEVGKIVGLANHTVLIRKDGSEIPIDDSAAPIFDGNGGVDGAVLVFHDVTQRRGNERKLARSELELRDLFDHASIGIHWVGPEGTILRANQTELDMLGYSSDEYVGRSIAEFHADEPVIADILRALTAGKSLYDYPARLVCKDGTIKNVLINSNVFREDGKFIHTRCFTRDVTEITAAQDAQAHLAAIVEASEDAIISKRLDGTITSWNRGAERHFGYTADQAVGKNILMLIPPDRHGEEKLIIEQLKAGQRITTYDTIRLRRDGTPIDVSLTISPIRDASGTIVGASKFARDITERKEIEQQLRKNEEQLVRNAEVFKRLVEQSPFGIYTVDSHFCVHQVSVGAQKVFQNVRPLIGRDFAEALRIVWPEPLATNLIDIFRHTLDTGESYLAPSLTAPRGDIERTESYEWQAHRVTLPDGQFGVVCYYFDSTLLRQTEDELRTVAANLSEADRRKNEFLAMLAHELRNPLAPIRNALQIMQITDHPYTDQATLDMMDRQLSQLVRLVDDLLDISRISTGKIELRKRRTELADFVNQALEAARPNCENYGIELKASLPKESIFVDGDPARLAQAVGNILNNASKFTDPGGSIDLAVTLEDAHALISIRDDGIGIAPDEIGVIFDMFVQADTSIKRSSSGLGIGLTLVKKLVEMHGGTVTASSGGLGMGTEFVIRLPLLAMNESTRSAHVAKSANISNTVSRRVLVVDDNVDSAASMEMLLKITGHDVCMAHDGISAVKRAEEFLPEVILLDIGLPGLNGYEVAHRIKDSEWGKSIVLIALTGWGQEEDRQRSKDAGFSRHMVKPIEHTELIKILDELSLSEDRDPSRG